MRPEGGGKVCRVVGWGRFGAVGVSPLLPPLTYEDCSAVYNTIGLFCVKIGG